MKNQYTIDPELIDTDPEPDPLKKDVLSDQDSYLLALTKYMVIKGKKFFMKKRYNTRIEAEKNLESGKIIVESRIAAFILTLKEPKFQQVFEISNYI